MVISESLIKVVISEIFKKLPPGTGDQIVQFLQSNMTTIEETKNRLQRIEKKLDYLCVETVKCSNLPDNEAAQQLVDLEVWQNDSNSSRSSVATITDGSASG